jgi:hypothetical protein
LEAGGMSSAARTSERMSRIRREIFFIFRLMICTFVSSGPDDLYNFNYYHSRTCSSTLSSIETTQNYERDSKF